MKILGIDPGSTMMGYGLIEEHKDGTLHSLEHGVLKNTAETTIDKIQLLVSDLEKLIHRIHPDRIGLEIVFFSKNKKTALEVAQARGAIISTLLKLNVPIAEFTPGQIKSALTNIGNADKKMVAKMVGLLLKIETQKMDDNAADALAVAITTASYSRNAQANSS